MNLKRKSSSSQMDTIAIRPPLITQQEKQEQTGNKDPNAPFNYIMVVLCNMFDPGLSILPTHRFIKMPNVNFDDLDKKLETIFHRRKKIDY